MEGCKGHHEVVGEGVGYTSAMAANVIMLHGSLTSSSPTNSFVQRSIKFRISGVLTKSVEVNFNSKKGEKG